MTGACGIAADYADYNRLRGNDRSLQLEFDFGLRLGDDGLRALRSGFGVYRGVGGSLVDLDELDLSPRKTGLTYGYLEAELAVDRGFLGGGVNFCALAPIPAGRPRWIGYSPRAAPDTPNACRRSIRCPTYVAGSHRPC